MQIHPLNIKSYTLVNNASVLFLAGQKEAVLRKKKPLRIHTLLAPRNDTSVEGTIKFMKIYY